MRQALNQVTVGVEDVHKPRAGASHRIVPGGVLLSISDVEIRTDPLDVEWGKATRNPGIPLIPLIPVVLEGICTQVHLLEVGVEYVNVPATEVSGQNELLSADFGNVAPLYTAPLAALGVWELSTLITALGTLPDSTPEPSHLR